jgi:hypothetical protein
MAMTVNIVVCDCGWERQSDPYVTRWREGDEVECGNCGEWLTVYSTELILEDEEDEGQDIYN